MKVIIAVTGASGTQLGYQTLTRLPEHVEKHLILSKNSARVDAAECGITVHDADDIGAPPASGSFQADIMMVIPCSMNTLAKVACGLADNLVTRAASVMIKERKTLLLAPREMPFSAIALENMLKLSRLGIIIAPPVMAYYSGQQTLEEMESFMIGKWFDLVGIENDLYKRWGSDA